MNQEEEYNKIVGTTENINNVCTNSGTLMVDDDNNNLKKIYCCKITYDRELLK